MYIYLSISLNQCIGQVLRLITATSLLMVRLTKQLVEVLLNVNL